MIARLNGKVIEVLTESLVLDVAGVGYEVLMPGSELENAPKPGQALEVFIHTHFNRDSGSRLYGFMTAPGLRAFRVLISASGVGPKVGLGLLSRISAAGLVTAIVQGNIDLLATVPGVSRKGAEKLALELRDKFKGEPGAEALNGGQANEDALAALIALGYPASLARRALVEIDAKEQQKAEELVRLALQRISK
jgi:Holliday junction DNA helicase RuvA